MIIVKPNFSLLRADRDIIKMVINIVQYFDSIPESQSCEEISQVGSLYTNSH